MTRLLVIDDQASDLDIATGVAACVGIDIVQQVITVGAAQILLESALEGSVPAPDVIVLDLDLGFESGHELLRFWHRRLRGAGIAMIVWTVMAEEQRGVCELFGVQAVVSKREGPGALEAALRMLCGSGDLAVKGV